MKKLDILDREEFVAKLIDLLEKISDNKASTCFALNGEWGSGKSFVLDMFEERISQIQSETTFTDKYFVIRYNCWKYDYYEEPLIAIVVKLLELIEKKEVLAINPEEKHKLFNIAKIVSVAGLSIANASIRAATGVDFQNLYDSVEREKNGIAEEYEKEHSHDLYFAFNKVMDKLRGFLKEIAREYTVIIIVDELDRCLPEYAIKVLERLHHLTEETKNIITIVAIDKEQLMSSVKHAFGFENPEKYLEKFFHFEVKLDNGVSSDKILEKYEPYISLFDKKLLAFNESIEECLRAIFNGLDMRTQEQIVQKAMLTHKLLFDENDVKKDYSFMCMELILGVVVFVCNGNVGLHKRQVVGLKSLELCISENVHSDTRGIRNSDILNFFNEKIENLTRAARLGAGVNQGLYILANGVSLYGAILYAWYLLCPETGINPIHISQNNSYDIVLKNREDMKKYFETIQMMR